MIKIIMFFLMSCAMIPVVLAQEVQGMNKELCTVAQLGGRNNMALVEEYIKQGADINTYCDGEKTSLMAALWMGNIEKIKFLLDHGADPNLLRKGGDNIIVPISMSAVMSNLSHAQVAEIVKTMIEHGAKLELKDNTYGYTPLMWMIEYNQLEAVKVLLDAGSKRDVVDNNGDTPLAKASKDGRLEIVKMLSGSQQAATDPELEKSLCNAVWQNKQDIIKLLIPQIKKMPACALNQAVYGDQVDAAALLLDAGADPNAVYKGETPLVAAADKGNEAMVALLLNRKADPNLLSNERWTPLTTAAYQGNLNIVKMLLEHHAGVDAKAQYETAFQVAVGQKHEDVARLLLEAGADMIDNFTRNWIALHKAAELGEVGIMTAMLEKGAGVDVRNGNDMTPLMVACEFGHLDAVKILLDHKANIEAINAASPITDVGDNFVGTPLQWAQHGKHQDIVDYLVSRGANSNLKAQ